MVKPGKVKEGIKGIGDNKRCNMNSLLDKSFRINNFSHPVAGKGENIPQDDKPEETFEFKPSWSTYTVLVYPVQKVTHTGDEQDMSDLMGYETF